MTKQKTYCIKPFPLGAHAEGDKIRFSFISREKNCGVLIYDKKTGRRIKKLAFEPYERVGNIWCTYLTGLDAEKISYQFYEGDEPVPDRYARMYVTRAAYGRECGERDRKAAIPRDDFDWEGDVCPRIPYSECVCYCAHVRGFTRHTSSGVAHRGTFLGMTEKLDYLREIGVTTVELQPAYEFAEIATREERRRLLGGQTASQIVKDADLDSLFPKKCNYWGYKQGYYYAPKAAYAAGEDAASEFKEMVKAFHRAGIEIVMQFYFPGTVRVMEIADILRYWVLEFHVDGFHLMGADLPVEILASDPALADTKLWYYHFDTDKIYGRGEFPEQPNLAVYHDGYLYVMRKFLKGDEGMLGEVQNQMRQIPQKMGRIHYMSNYYGFTLMDMVSYDRKHNEANGEDNRDGNDNNCSWNCGEEGMSRRKKILALRHRQLKNAIVMLLFSQSTPLIFMGDEFGNSQKGNNNPYCQDNATTWLDWNDINRNQDIHIFWKQMVKLRRDHPILRPDQELKIMDYISCGYPDLSYHGQNAWRPRTESYFRHMGIMYCGKYAKLSREEEDNFFYLAMNMYWEPKELALPKLPKGLKWELLVSTAGELTQDISPDGIIAVGGRSILVYISRPDDAQEDRGKGRKKKTQPTAEAYSDRTAF